MRGEGLTSHGVASVHGAAVNGEKVGLAAQTRERHLRLLAVGRAAGAVSGQCGRPACAVRSIWLMVRRGRAGPPPAVTAVWCAELHGRTPRA